MTVFGVSYGTFVAEHYSLAHPRQDARARARLGRAARRQFDPLAVDLMQASRRVLRDACRDVACPGDPVADLADVIKRYDDGVDLLDLIDRDEHRQPDVRRRSSPRLRSAAEGNPGQLDQLVANYHSGMKGPARRAQPGSARQCAVRRHELPVGRLGRSARRPG